MEEMGFDPDRFVAAQDRIWPRPLEELRAGAKRSHWMWFVFPQLAGLGRSETARFYALPGADAARAYAAHPVLGPRLDAGIAAALASPEGRAEALFGGIDAVKFRSCLTLFGAVLGAGAPLGARCADGLARFYGGAPDPRTLELLR